MEIVKVLVTNKADGMFVGNDTAVNVLERNGKDRHYVNLFVRVEQI